MTALDFSLVPAKKSGDDARKLEVQLTVMLRKKTNIA